MPLVDCTAAETATAVTPTEPEPLRNAAAADIFASQLLHGDCREIDKVLLIGRAMFGSEMRQKLPFPRCSRG